jgi:hypothetical protein
MNSFAPKPRKDDGSLSYKAMGMDSGMVKRNLAKRSKG